MRPRPSARTCRRPASGAFSGRGERWLARGEETIVASSELPIAGAHNELNVLAAMALARAMGASSAAMASAVSSFAGLPHRCQRVVRAHAGVSYINDSKATNVGATCAALVGLGEIRRREKRRTSC